MIIPVNKDVVRRAIESISVQNKTNPKFNWALWCSEDTEFNRGKSLHDFHNCGTSACIAGHIVFNEQKDECKITHLQWAEHAYDFLVQKCGREDILYFRLNAFLFVPWNRDALMYQRLPDPMLKSSLSSDDYRREAVARLTWLLEERNIEEYLPVVRI